MDASIVHLCVLFVLRYFSSFINDLSPVERGFSVCPASDLLCGGLFFVSRNEELVVHLVVVDGVIQQPVCMLELMADSALKGVVAGEVERAVARPGGNACRFQRNDSAARVSTDEPAGAELDTAKIAHNAADDVRQLFFFQHLEHRHARCARRFAVVRKSHLKTAGADDPGRADVRRLRMQFAQLRDKSARFFF